MKVFLDSIGCRLNQSEIETMARQLLASGHEIVGDPATADKVIINTCTVTREAAKDARKMTRRIHRENEQAGIILTGCYATVSPGELRALQGVQQVVGNGDKERVVQLLDPEAITDLPLYDREPITREFLPGHTGYTRAFVKVQDGCDNRCTFCITTIARGAGRSRSVGDVVCEIQALSEAGYQEAVLTGVHMGSYGRDLAEDVGLGDLVRAILRHTDIARLRLSSLEPWDISLDFFELWQDPRLLPHLHLPLQSGSDRVLRRMARRTSRVTFRQLADEARKCIPNLNLSTDIIVGFPGESRQNFLESLEYVAEIGFSRLHVFTYSRRPGTAAATMDGQLSKAVKKERARQMITLGQELSLDFHESFLGHEAHVLWETAVGADENGLRWIGYAGNYIRVSANGPADLFNRVTLTRLLAAHPDGMAGTILDSGH